jgi:hypothetical protein
MSPEIFTRAAIADFCIREGSRHGGVDNMAAIAWVLRNRVFAGWGDWYDVVTDAPSKRAVIYDDWRIDIRSSQVRIFLSRLDGIHNGTEIEDPVNGAVYYTEPRLQQTDWFRKSVLDRKESFGLLAKVGPIHFLGSRD